MARDVPWLLWSPQAECVKICKGLGRCAVGGRGSGPLKIENQRGWLSKTRLGSGEPGALACGLTSGQVRIGVELVEFSALDLNRAIGESFGRGQP